MDMLTLIVIVFVGLTAVFDLLPGIKNRPKKETVIYSLLLAAGFGILLLFSLDVKVPGPTEPIRAIVKALFPVK